jgi:hypothetical protein
MTGKSTQTGWFAENPKSSKKDGAGFAGNANASLPVAEKTGGNSDTGRCSGGWVNPGLDD